MIFRHAETVPTVIYHTFPKSRLWSTVVGFLSDNALCGVKTATSASNPCMDLTESLERMNEKTPKVSYAGIRILLVAKYQMVQESLKLLIESGKDMSVQGTYSFSETFTDCVEMPEADVAVVYVSEGDRVEIIGDLINRHSGLRVVAIVAGADLDAQADALKLGAVGIVQKEQSPKLLMEAIRQTYSGESWLNQVLLNKILERSKTKGKKMPGFALRTETESLTCRELEVIKMIGEGLKNKTIAERLFISEATVRHHLSSIYGKVAVEDRLNLVIFAYRQGLIKLSDAPHENVP